jgi:hypothetical protein
MCIRDRDNHVPEGPEAGRARAKALLRRGQADEAWRALADPMLDPALAARIAIARDDRTEAQKFAAAAGSSSIQIAIDAAWIDGDAARAMALIEQVPERERRAADTRRLSLIRSFGAADEIDRMREVLRDE